MFSLVVVVDVGGAVFSVVRMSVVCVCMSIVVSVVVVVVVGWLVGRSVGRSCCCVYPGRRHVCSRRVCSCLHVRASYCNRRP